MSTLKTHNLQSPDAGSVNIALTANAGMIVTGISTFNDRINIGSLGVTTNFTVAGISTFTGIIDADGGIKLDDNKVVNFGNQYDLQLYHTGTHGYIKNKTGSLYIMSTNTEYGIEVYANGKVSLNYDNSTKIQTTNTGAVVTGILTATSFSGDGSSLSNLPAGAPVGGASTNTVFFENDKEVAVNYQITSTKNAMSAGPIAINAGIAVTVPSGCSWTIV